MLTNALAPLMEEIKEKDHQIRTLHEAMEDKNLKIDSLTLEVDQLHQNIAAQITEKIRHVRVSGGSGCDSSGEFDQHSTDGESCAAHRRRQESESQHSCQGDSNELHGTEAVLPFAATHHHKSNNTVELPGRISPELDLTKQRMEFSQRGSCTSSTSSIGASSTKTTCVALSSEDELVVSKEQFCDLLLQHHETMEKKDMDYYRSTLESPTTLRDRINNGGNSNGTSSENRYVASSFSHFFARVMIGG